MVFSLRPGSGDCVCENLNEAKVPDIGRTVSVANTSVTRLVRADGAVAWTLDFFNAQQHLTEHGGQPTEHPAEHDVDPH